MDSGENTHMLVHDSILSMNRNLSRRWTVTDSSKNVKVNSKVESKAHLCKKDLTGCTAFYIF